MIIQIRASLMRDMIRKIKVLQKGPIKDLIDSRMQEFYSMRHRKNKTLFNEMCFCLLTANWQAAGAIRIQKAMKHEFCVLPRSKLSRRLREQGHRFPNVRAGFIEDAQKHKDSMRSILYSKDFFKDSFKNSFEDSFEDSFELRQWVVKNVKGLGMKEASHFLRNVGFDDLAIIDFHIIDLLARDSIIERPKTITPKRYLDIERVLRKMAGRAGISLAELDLYLWYIETGKILK